MLARFVVIALFLLAAVGPQSAVSAQVIREDGTKSIAGLLGGPYGGSAIWSFRSGGGEVLFASLAAELYAVNDAHHEEQPIPTTGERARLAAEEGGCSDGSARFCLQVVDAAGVPICTAGRPMGAPGWQRDPRVACVIPDGSPSSLYGVRVALIGGAGCGDPAAVIAVPIPFLLDVSLRGIASSGSQVHSAVAHSANRF